MLDLCGLGVLVFVDHVLRGTFGHEKLSFRFHPGRHERRQIQSGVAIEHQLVMNDLERCPGRHALRGEP